MSICIFPVDTNNFLADTKTIAQFRAVKHQTAGMPFAWTNKLELGCCVTQDACKRVCGAWGEMRVNQSLWKEKHSWKESKPTQITKKPDK